MVLATNTLVFLSRQKGKRATVGDLEAALGLPAGAPMMTDVLGMLARHRLVERREHPAGAVRLARRAGPLPLARVARAVGERLVTGDGHARTRKAATAADRVLQQIWEEILVGLESLDVFSLAAARPL